MSNLTSGPIGTGNNLMMPSLDKNVSSSQYNYQSKKGRKQNWFSLFKANKKLETELLLKGFS
jgi:hypothetical protein